MIRLARRESKALWPRVTYIGGPTALLEFDGLRVLTDPTFDPAGTEYRTATYVLRKTQGPGLSAQEVGAVDLILLSHDHHFDNLDHVGRAFVEGARQVVTTAAGAGRIGGRAIGLEPWRHLDVETVAGRRLRITATPARHGPANGDRGPVIGFVLAFTDSPAPTVYVTGDSVWHEGIAEVARRFAPHLVLLFAGAARVPEAGSPHLTFTAEEAVIAARAFDRALIVPLHFEGWAHFSESRGDLERAFADAHLSHRVRWPATGRPLEFPFLGGIGA